MKQLEVNIMGQSYLLACPDGGEAALSHAVNKVDNEMCAIRDAGKVRARERIAVLAALNLAYQLTQRMGVSSSSPLPSASLDVAAAAELTNIVERLDKALAADGNLL